MKPAPACTKCSTPLPAEFLNSGQYLPCPKCQSQLRIELFPSYFREETKGSAGEALLIDSEASCFYHPQKRAAVVCSSCGRFLCSLCDVELDNAHYCTGCLEAAKEKGKIAAIENTRKLHDTLAIQLAFAGFFPYIMPFTAPAAIYVAIKYWKSPSSIVREPTKWRQITAIIIASLQLLLLAFLIVFLVTRFLPH